MQQRTLVVYGNQQIGDEIAKALVSKEVKRFQEENEKLQKKAEMEADFRRIELENRNRNTKNHYAVKPEPRMKQFFELCMAMTVVVPEYMSNRRKIRHGSAAKHCGSFHLPARGGAA